jgi:predicted ATPase
MNCSDLEFHCFFKVLHLEKLGKKLQHGKKLFRLKMVFCYQNCSDLLREKLLKFEAEGREFAKFLRSLEQFIQTVKGQNNFW